MKILLLMMLVPCQLLSQDFTGIWTGFLTSKQSRLPYELVISGEKGSLRGYSLTVFIIDNTENTGVKTLKIKSKKDGIAIEDDELIFEDYTIASKKVTLYGMLSFEAGSTSVLQGTFFTRAMDRTSYNGSIRLEKKNDLAKTKLIGHLERLNLLSGLSFLKPEPPGEEKTKVAPAEIAKEEVPFPRQSPTGETTGAPVLKEGQEPASLPGVTKPVLPTNSTSVQPTHNAVNTLKVTGAPVDQAAGGEITAAPALKEGQQAARLPGTKPVVTTPTASIQPANNAVSTLKAATDLAARKTEIIRTISFQSDSLVLSLYDNGEVDGDTVSVLVNDNIVIARKGLSTNPVRTTVYIPPGFAGSLQVTMYAENLGRIAPNTGLLIVEDGNEKYQVRFEGDMQKNSAVVFRRKPNTDDTDKD